MFLLIIKISVTYLRKIYVKSNVKMYVKNNFKKEKHQQKILFLPLVLISTCRYNVVCPFILSPRELILYLFLSYFMHKESLPVYTLEDLPYLNNFVYSVLVSAM